MRSSSSSESVKRFGRLSLVLLLVLVALVIAAPAAFAGNGAIEGTVTAGPPTGTNGLYRIAVQVVPAGYASFEAADAHHHIEVAFTDGAGKYRVNNIPAGESYLVKFFDPTLFPLAWATQWYTDEAYPLPGMGAYDWPWIPIDASPVLVPSNTVVSDINAAMVPSSTLYGTLIDSKDDSLVGGIEVWPWYEGVGISWNDFVTGVETGRWSHGERATETDSHHPHIPEWIEEHMTYSASMGATGTWEIGPVEPRNYQIYFHDPSGEYAPDSTSMTPVPGQDAQDRTYLDHAGQIAGWVNADVDRTNEYDLPNVEVEVYADIFNMVDVGLDNYASHGPLVGVATTDGNGHYEIDGLHAGDYVVHFSAEGYNPYDSSTEVGRRHHDLYYPMVRHAEVHAWDTTEVSALLKPIPDVFFVHTPFGVNDGPDRYTTYVDIFGWGMFFLSDWWFEKQSAPNAGWVIDELRRGVDTTFTSWSILNLAAPLVPTGTYELHYTWTDPWGRHHEEVIENAYQVVNSYVDPQPVVTPTTATPTLPTTTPITPVVDPTPVVTPTPTPKPVVAGAITVSAPYKAVVKHGKKATLRFQVNEAVLGGTSAVKITVTNKAGAVVKRIAKSVTMNSAASVSFTCNLAKGAYTFSVSATGAASSASNTLTVK